MKHLALPVLFFGWTTLSAQQVISYKILKDDPKYLFHGMAGTFMDAELGLDGNIRPGLFGKAILNIGNLFSIKGEYLTGVKSWDRTIRNASTEIDKTYLDVNGRITINLQRNSTKALTNVTLSRYYDVDKSYEDRDGDGYWDTEIRKETSSEQYIAVPATTLTTAGLTISAGYYQNNIHQEKEKLFMTDGTYRQYLGTVISGMRYSAGLNVRVVRNIKINAYYQMTGERIGKRRTANRVDAGLEVLCMPQISIDRLVTVKESNRSLKITNAIAVQNWGARIFGELHLLHFPFLGFRVEAGSRPGIKFMIKENDKIGSLYMQIGVLASLGM